MERLQGSLSVMGWNDCRGIRLSWDGTTPKESLCPGMEFPGECFCTGMERLQGSHKPYKWNFTAQKGKGDREKRTSDRARTRDLRSIAEFQPREPRRPAEILRPPSPLCTGHRCAAIQRRLRPAPRGWYCVLCDGSRLSGA